MAERYEAHARRERARAADAQRGVHFSRLRRPVDAVRTAAGRALRGHAGQMAGDPAQVHVRRVETGGCSITQSGPSMLRSG
jgi:hypothetical protein